MEKNIKNSFLTTKEVAEMLRVCEETVRRYYRKGMINGERIGKRRNAIILFTMQDVKEFLKKSSEI